MFASLYLRAPRACSASVQSAARAPCTLFAARETPVPVQQNTTPWSASPRATASATPRPTSAHCSSRPPAGPRTAMISWPRSRRSSRTKSVRAVRSSAPAAIRIVPRVAWPPMPKTSFTELVGCARPLQLAGMGGVSTVELAAAVTNAGGLGMIGAAGILRDDLAEMLEKLETATDGPFGANFLMPFLDPEALSIAAERCSVVEFFYGEP